MALVHKGEHIVPYYGMGDLYYDATLIFWGKNYIKIQIMTKKILHLILEKISITKIKTDKFYLFISVIIWNDSDFGSRRTHTFYLGYSTSEILEKCFYNDTVWA